MTPTQLLPQTTPWSPTRITGKPAWWLAPLMLAWMTACNADTADTPAEPPDELRSLFQSGSRSSTDFLPPDEAFRFAARLESADTVKLEWVIAPGYYLYRDRLRIDSSAPEVQLGPPQLPQGQFKDDEIFGNTEVYYETAAASVAVKQGGKAQDLRFTVTYQGCAEAGLCYNPIVKEVVLPLSQPATSDRTKQIGDTARPSSQPVSSGGK